MGVGDRREIAHGNEIVTSISQLPKQDSRITNVYLSGNRQVTDDDLKRFKWLPKLHTLELGTRKSGTLA